MARLPNNGIVDWKASILIPNNSCFPLIGNSDSFDLSWFDATFDKGTSDNRLNRVPDFIWIVFNPTSLRENLRELFLARAYFFSFFIENDGSWTCCSLVNAIMYFSCDMNCPPGKKKYSLGDVLLTFSIIQYKPLSWSSIFLRILKKMSSKASIAWAASEFRSFIKLNFQTNLSNFKKEDLRLLCIFYTLLSP